MDEYERHLMILNEACDCGSQFDDGIHLAASTLTLLGLGDA